jgi:hypothetical protein
MRKLLLILATFALMVACCAGALLAALSYFMSLGLKYHNNYEYYGQFPGVVLMIFAAGAMGFLAPGFVVLYLYNNPIEIPRRFSLRNLLIITTLVAIVVGMVAAIWRISN